MLQKPQLNNKHLHLTNCWKNVFCCLKLPVSYSQLDSFQRLRYIKHFHVTFCATNRGFQNLATPANKTRIFGQEQTNLKKKIGCVLTSTTVSKMSSLDSYSPIFGETFFANFAAKCPKCDTLIENVLFLSPGLYATQH